MKFTVNVTCDKVTRYCSSDGEDVEVEVEAPDEKAAIQQAIQEVTKQVEEDCGSDAVGCWNTEAENIEAEIVSVVGATEGHLNDNLESKRPVNRHLRPEPVWRIQGQTLRPYCWTWHEKMDKSVRP